MVLPYREGGKMSERNLIQRLAAITAELQTVAKNLTVETGKGKGYKAVSERDIIDAVKPLEAKYGVFSFPMRRESVAAEMLETETQYGKKTSFYTRLKTLYRFVNVDDPTDYIDTEVFSVGIDSQDKGDGKAMTYGDKYALMKVYKISTGDDPDQTASVDEDYSKRKPAAKSAAIPEKREAVICADCGKPVVPVMKTGGEEWPVSEMAVYSTRRFGRYLCGECMKAAFAEEKKKASDDEN